MPKEKCQHYKMCASSDETLCGDLHCYINRQNLVKEKEEQYAEVVQCLTKIKQDLGINSFLDLNNK